MAIDTEDKRRSAMARIYGVIGAGIAPVPDGTIDASDRAHITGFYRGITYASPAFNRGFLLNVYRQHGG